MLVSIYIPTKNRLALLRQAIDSVLAQTMTDFELIVVNDGSSDGTRAYLDQVRSTDRRIICVHNDASRGGPACRNEAIRRASGEFVTGLDDDDTFEPYRLETFVAGWRLMECCHLPTSLLYGQDKWFRDGRHVYTTMKKGSVLFSDMVVQNQVGNQVFAPKAHYIDAGLFDETLPAWQDVDLFTRILRRSGTGRLIDVPSYNFEVSQRPDRISIDQRRVTMASQIVRNRYFAGNGRSAQLIALQVFSEFYGFRPAISDLRDFASHGMWPLGLARMTAAWLKRRPPAIVLPNVHVIAREALETTSRDGASPDHAPATL